MKRHYKIAIGGDHGGFELKQQLAAYLLSRGHNITDCGTHGTDPVDYPNIARSVAEKVASGRCDFGVVVDGAGIGSAMAANKVPGILAAACYNEALARNAREHNNANVLTLGSKQTSLSIAKKIVDIFLETDCTEERHLRRVQIIRDIEAHRIPAAAGNPVAAAVARNNPGVAADDMARITNRVKEILGDTAPPGFNPAAALMTPEELTQMIDHTILKPEASLADVQKLCEEAVKHNFFSVCVNPSYVKHAKKFTANSPVKVCAVVGFPLGAQPPATKALEARQAIRDGAKEIDMVINVGALKSGDEQAVYRDIRAVVEACRDGGALLKVILETSLLTDAEKVRACELSMKAGADYVKTSTGFGSAGATAHDIALMARTVAPKKLGVKASGGVRTYRDAVEMIQAGATRIGASSSIKIIEEARQLAGKGLTGG